MFGIYLACSYVWHCVSYSLNTSHTWNCSLWFTNIIRWWLMNYWKCMLWRCNYFARVSGGEVLCWARLCVCLSVCLSARISPEPLARSLAVFLCKLPMAVARSFSSRVTKSHGEEVVLGVFFPTDNTLYSIAWDLPYKTADPIQIPFGMMTRLRCSLGTVC